MKLDKTLLQDLLPAGEYLTPKVKVMEIKGRRMMSASPSYTEDSEEEDTDDWF